MSTSQLPVVSVHELRVGMFVHLELGWMSHPFPLSSFRIASQEQIDTIRGLGKESFRWVPEKSELIDDAERAAEVAAEAAAAARAQAQLSPEELAAQQRREQLAAQREAARQCEAQYAEASNAWRDAMGSVAEQPEKAAQQTQALARAMLDKMLGEGDMCVKLLSSISGDRATAHAMNVTVVSMLLARSLNMEPEELLDLGIGSMLHDVGKLDVPEHLRHLDERMEHGDVQVYRSHVAAGVSQGRRMKLAPGAMLVIAQHHEHHDGGGFPMRFPGEKLGVGARIVALVNRFDNLCNPPSLSRSMTPHEALSFMFAKCRSHFDPALMNAFIRMMGVYPAGSVVQLTDERYGLVVSVNSSRPLKPRVLVFDAEVPRDEALVLELEQHPHLGIRRSLKAAQLPAEAFNYLQPRPRVAYYFEAAPAPQREDREAREASPSEHPGERAAAA
jgi:putative nucleotidyltransferase with HDIG domain